MSDLSETPFNIRPDAFAGTARYYARFRPPYPESLIVDLRKRASISGKGRLLDLGSGPGRVALALAPFFKNVVAVDLEPEMIEVGKEEAERSAITNVEWRVGRAEDVTAPASSFELITMGESFHRFDQPVILEKAFEWLIPGGYLVGLGCRNVWNGDESWHELLKAVRNRWKPSGVASGHPNAIPSNVRYGEIMAKAGFIDMGDHEFNVPFEWTVESLIGNAYTSSVMSKKALGDKAGAFEADLRKTILAKYPDNRLPEILSFEYTLARRPN